MLPPGPLVVEAVGVEWVVGVGAIVFLLAALTSSVEIVDGSERRALTVRGEFRGTLQPGVNLVPPFVSETASIDTGPGTVDVPEQEVSTLDGVVCTVDVTADVRITDPERFYLAFDGDRDALEGPIGDVVQAVVAERTRDDVLNDEEGVSSELLERVREAAEEWGVDVDSAAVREASELAGPETPRLDWTPFELVSRYGSRYEIANVPGRLRELRLPPDGTTVDIREVEGAIYDLRSRDDVDESDLAVAIRTVRTHEEDLESYIDDRESSFHEVLTEAHDHLDDCRRLVDRLDGELHDRVEELVIEGRHPDLVGISEIKRAIRDAKSALHRCAFEEASNAIADARNDAETLVTTVDFLGSLVGAVGHESRRVAVPDAVDAAVLSAEVVPILEREYDVDIDVSDGRIAIDYPDAGIDETAEHRDKTASRSVEGGSTASPEELTDEVLFLLRELETGLNPETRTVEYQTERLPENVRRREVFEQFAAFCRRQPDLVEEVTVQEGAPPGFIELQLTDRHSPEAALTQIRERYVDSYQ